jgi:glucose-6-phosphate isomerase, archaeal
MAEYRDHSARASFKPAPTGQSLTPALCLTDQLTTHMLPFPLDLTPTAFRAFPGARANLRRLSDISDVFMDTAAVQRSLAENPLIYEFFDLRDALQGSRLSFGLTVLQPGAIGGEYFMTRGHFHALAQDGDELYLGISGQGLLQLQSRACAGQTLELGAGRMLYTPLAWAHRTINTGSEPLVFFSIWPSSTAYDYEEITRRGGFPERVFEQNGRPTLTPNPQFRI